MQHISYCLGGCVNIIDLWPLKHNWFRRWFRRFRDELDPSELPVYLCARCLLLFHLYFILHFMPMHLSERKKLYLFQMNGFSIRTINRKRIWKRATFSFTFCFNEPCNTLDSEWEDPKLKLTPVINFNNAHYIISTWINDSSFVVANWSRYYESTALYWI